MDAAPDVSRPPDVASPLQCARGRPRPNTVSLHAPTLLDSGGVASQGGQTILAGDVGRCRRAIIIIIIIFIIIVRCQGEYETKQVQAS